MLLRHSARALASRRCAARGMVVWGLILALLVYGYSSALLQILGPMHRHVAPGPANAVTVFDPLVQGLGELAATLRQWHERAQSQQMLFTHERERERERDGERARAHELSHEHGREHGHVHYHGLFERHHHDAGDDSVVALDASSSRSPASDGLSASATLGSATLPLCIPSALVVPAPACGRSQWLHAGTPTWRSAELKQADRPPCA